ncbi:MAG: hypothetical protein K0R71_334 [Bacillales bacterium]|jgi:uncharacterized Tic20 family protein|nr:hypothetical protein [Bacillales bacterium]
MNTKDERIFAMLIYLSSLLAPLLGPLVIWFLKKDESEFVDFHGRNYFNFFITSTIAGFIFGILVFVAIGIPLLFLLGIYVFVFTIIGAIKAYDGDKYVIPFTFKFFF